MSDITCSMHGVHPGSFTFSLVDAYIYHEYLKKIFAVDAVCVQRAVTLSRQWTQTASKAAERVNLIKHVSHLSGGLTEKRYDDCTQHSCSQN